MSTQSIDQFATHAVECPHCKGVGTVEVPPIVASCEAYYFGCWGQPGHYWRHPTNPLMKERDIEARVPEPFRRGRIDSGFCPGAVKGSAFDRTRPEVEGEAALHHVDGWTVLAWWDRSVDRRGACNSNVVARGTFDFAAMLEVLKRQFPGVAARQKSALRLVVWPGGAKP